MDTQQYRRAGRAIMASLACAVLLWGTPLSVSAAASDHEGDRVGIEATLDRYHAGLDRHDPKLFGSAFTEDATFSMNGGIIKGRDAIEQFIVAGNQRRAEAAEKAKAGGMPAPAEQWTFTSNDHVEFTAADRAIHTGYWFDIRVSPAAGQAPEGGPPSMPSGMIGLPGRYEDILVKREGRWLILERKMFVAQK